MDRGFIELLVPAFSELSLKVSNLRMPLTGLIVFETSGSIWGLTWESGSL